MIKVNWHDAQEYVRWLSASEPAKPTGCRRRRNGNTAARAGTTGRFSNNGDEGDLCDIANHVGRLHLNFHRSPCLKTPHARMGSIIRQRQWAPSPPIPGASMTCPWQCLGSGRRIVGMAAIAGAPKDGSAWMDGRGWGLFTIAVLPRRANGSAYTRTLRSAFRDGNPRDVRYAASSVFVSPV